MAEPFRIAFVCLGNICRSPMAHVVAEHRLAAAGLSDEVTIVSAGTGDWHVGHPMDPRAAATLEAAGYDPSKHRARHFTPDWFVENDLLLAMDEANYADMEAQRQKVSDIEKLHLFRSFDPLASPSDIEVPDPYYGGDEGFVHVLDMVERTCDNLIENLDRLRTSGGN